MEIEITKQNKKSYDEMFYVAINYRKYIKKANKKVKLITSSITKMLIFCLIFIAILMLFNGVFSQTFFNILIGCYLVLIILLFLMLIIYKMKINKLIKSNKKYLIFNETFIEIKDNLKDVKIKWEDIAKVLIGKYSICFLPKTSNIMISVNIDYEEDILKAIHKFSYDNLIDKR